jgi:hypothetical protein
MSGYKNVVCEGCKSLWWAIDPAYPWFCCYCKKEELQVPGGCHDPRPMFSDYNIKYTELAPPVPPRNEWPKLVKSEEPSPEDRMIDDMQQQLQTAQEEKLSVQTELLSTLKLLRDERVRNLELLRQTQQDKETREFNYNMAMKYIRLYSEACARVEALQGSLWTRFKRWAKKEWEAEV